MLCEIFKILFTLLGPTCNINENMAHGKGQFVAGLNPIVSLKILTSLFSGYHIGQPHALSIEKIFFYFFSCMDAEKLRKDTHNEHVTG